MSWFIFAFSSAIFYALNFVLLKKFLKSINQFVFAFGNYFLISIVLFVISFLKGLPTLAPSFYLAVYLSAFLNIFITIFTYRAVQLTDLSLAVPMMSFTPLFLILTSFLILGELPGWLGVVGIVLIVFGSYLLDVSGKAKNLFSSFSNLFKNKGQMLMLAAAFCAGLSVNFDKMAVLNSDWLFGSAMTYFLLAVSFLIISLFKKREILKTTIRNLDKFFLSAAFAVLTVICINLAYTMQIAAYVISIKRIGALFSVLLGALFFKEKDIPKRFIGAFIMLIGVIVIIFS